MDRKLTEENTPHLSVVAVSRNDDHGGDLQGRMQHFVDGFIAQCRKHRLDAELILVEWNPPIERPPLEDSLEWPADFGPATVRVITVPPDLHAALPHSDALALFQMIGKNVGIRRARGRFVLATNIDILFDDATVRYLRDRLQDGTMLRANRFDVPSNLPERSTFERVLDDCRSRWFQVHMRLGTFDAKRRRLVDRDRGITARLLALHCETQLYGWADLVGRAGRRLSADLRERWSKAREWIAFIDRRTLAQATEVVLQGLRRLPRLVQNELAKISPLTTLPDRAYWRAHRLWRRRPRGTVLRRKIRSIPRRINNALAQLPKAWNLVLPMVQVTPKTPFARRLARMRRLHTNGCGDFTLLSRDDWFRLRGYPEWPIFSWHIDSVFLFAASAHDIPQVTLDGQHRIYHIDHSKGSGWSHDGAAQLFARLDRNGIPYISNEFVQRKQLEFAKTPSSAIINGEDWGLVDYTLPERAVLPAATNQQGSQSDSDKRSRSIAAASL